MVRTCTSTGRVCRNRIRRFAGAPEQIAEDVKTTQKLGAAEIVLDAQFSPGVETASDLVSRMEKLWRMAKPT